MFSYTPKYSDAACVLLKIEIAAGVEQPIPGSRQRVHLIAPGESILVGRGKGFVHLAVEQDRTMSKQHFEIAFDGSTCRLTDMNSSNGTYVNGSRMTHANLADGDRIRAGTSLLSVNIGPANSFERNFRTTAQDDLTPDNGSGETLSDELPLVNDEVSDGVAAASQRTPLIVPRIVTLRIDDGNSRKPSAHVLSRLLTWIRPGQSVTVGMSADRTSWRIDNDPAVAPLHFEVSFDGKVCFVKSLDGDRATYVNGRPISYHMLAGGDTITAGNTTFLVEFS